MHRKREIKNTQVNKILGCERKRMSTNKKERIKRERGGTSFKRQKKKFKDKKSVIKRR